jgi:hypothetical protein
MLGASDAVAARLPGAPLALRREIEELTRLVQQHILEIGTTSSDTVKLVVAKDLDDVFSQEHASDAHVIGFFNPSFSAEDLKPALVSACTALGLVALGTVRELEARLGEFDAARVDALVAAGCLVSRIKGGSVFYVLSPPDGCACCKAPVLLRDKLLKAIDAREAGLPAVEDIHDAGEEEGDGAGGDGGGGAGEERQLADADADDPMLDPGAPAPAVAAQRARHGPAKQQDEREELQGLRQLAEAGYASNGAILLHAFCARAQACAFKRMCASLKWGSIIIEFDFKQKMKMGNYARADKSKTYVTNKASMLGVVVVYCDRAGEAHRLSVGLHSLDCNQDATCIISALREIAKMAKNSPNALPQDLVDQLNAGLTSVDFWADCATNQNRNSVLLSWLNGWVAGSLRSEWSAFIAAGCTLRVHFFGEQHGKSFVDTFFGWITVDYQTMARGAQHPISMAELVDYMERHSDASAREHVIFINHDTYRASHEPTLHVDGLRHLLDCRSFTISAAGEAMGSPLSDAPASVIASAAVCQQAVVAPVTAAGKGDNPNKSLDLDAEAGFLALALDAGIAAKQYQRILYNGKSLVRTHQPWIRDDASGTWHQCTRVLQDIMFLIDSARYDAVRERKEVRQVPNGKSLATTVEWLARCERALAEPPPAAAQPALAAAVAARARAPPRARPAAGKAAIGAGGGGGGGQAQLGEEGAEPAAGAAADSSKRKRAASLEKRETHPREARTRPAAPVAAVSSQPALSQRQLALAAAAAAAAAARLPH